MMRSRRWIMSAWLVECIIAALLIAKGPAISVHAELTTVPSSSAAPAAADEARWELGEEETTAAADPLVPDDDNLTASTQMAADMAAGQDGEVDHSVEDEWEQDVDATTEEEEEERAATRRPTLPPNNWYVSLAGFRSGICGTSKAKPCRDLAHVIAIAQDYDTIYVDGQPSPYSTDHIYSLCHNREFNLQSYLLKKSLNIVGTNGTPTLGCSSEYDMNSWNDNGSIVLSSHHTAEFDCRVLLSNLIVRDGIVPLGNCSVTLQDTLFVNASIKPSSPCHFLDLKIVNSKFSGGQHCDHNGSCEHKKLNIVYCLNSILRVSHSQFYQTSLVVDGVSATNITVSNCKFSNDNASIRFLGGLHLTFSAFLAHIHISNSTFENQIHPTRVESVINLFDAAIWLKVSQLDRTNNGTLTNATAVVENCVFDNNERGITMVGPFVKLLIYKCTFLNNVAMHAGAGMLVLIHKETSMAIINCTFINNMAGKYRNDYPIADKENSFLVVNSEVHLNAEHCKGVVSLVGKGGAIRVQQGFVEINDTIFINNTARLLGGSVFVDMDGTLNSFRTHFENTPVHDHALQGDVLYSDGTMNINDVKLIVRSADNGLSIFRHAGGHWSLEITNVWMQCPVGYDLRATNSSAYGVRPFGLKRSHKLDQLSYFCESCQRNKYSLDNGYLNYTMVFNSFSYFTLLINGSLPEPQYTGEYIHHIIKCSDCPYGGHCVQGISAVPNFWGYIQDRSVKFQHCPKRYCCSKKNCPTINSCADLREGRLCGRCREGYGEALFSPMCVPNEQCGPKWLYPFGFTVGLVYAIFLLFQADLQHFLFGSPLGICCSARSFKRTYQATYMNGNATTPPDTKCLPRTDGSEKGCEEGSSDSPYVGDNHVGTAGGSSVTEPLKPKPDLASPKKQKTKNESDCRMVGFGSGFLVIMFYYFQDALLLNVKTVHVHKEIRHEQLLKSILSGIFKFQLDLFELIEEVCAMSEMHAVHKTIAKALIVPYVIILFASMYVIYKWIQMVRGGLRTQRPVIAISTQHHDSNKKSFATRLSSGFILALLFMFQKMGTTTFILLNCVPVQGDKVLFIDGTITCYQYWQYGVMIYAVGSVTPFFIVVCVGPTMLQRGQISLTEFFIGCLVPLPVLLVWVVRAALWSHGRRPQPHVLPANVKAVLQVMQGPFIENQYGVCWSGVLVGRRLVLILLFTFVTDTLIRLLGMLLACFIILLHHVHVKPYKDPRGNIAGTMSAAALVILGSINLVRAGFEAAEYTPTGPNAFLMKIFIQIENALLMWVPMAVMTFVFFIFFIRVMSSVGKCFCSQDQQQQAVPAADSSPTEEDAPQS